MAIPRARPLRIATALLALASCDPYQRFGKGDDSYGPVDPSNFPPANLGARGDRTRAGQGSFTAAHAFVAGADAAYFAYPLPPAAPMSDPLAAASLGAPPAFAFDQHCQAPPNYAWDPAHMQTDEVRLDQQGAVFTALPKATYVAGVPATSTYVPVVHRVPVSAPDQPCQKLKSADAVTKAGLNTVPDGALLAWLIIDPAAAVFAPGKSAANDPGIGLQSWGWYNRYLLAYLDGGELPTGDEMVTDAMGATRTVSRVKAQKLYYPRSMVMTTKTMPDGTMMTTAAAGKLGAGYDVLQARRGQPGYSPLCQVLTYDTGAPTDMNALPKDAAAIEMSFATTLMPATPAYVYCLQVTP